MSNQDFYNQYWNQRGQAKGIRLRYYVFLDWLKQGSKVLDIGGGDGQLAEIIQKIKNCQAIVVDISDSALAIAQNRGLATVKANLEEKLPFRDNEFNVAILSEILEHLAFSEQLLEEASRVSSDYILVSLPNTGYFKYRWQLLFGHFPKQWLVSPREHLRFWTLADFKKMVAYLNLEIVDMKASAGRRYLRDLWPSLLAEQICFKLRKKQ